MRRGFLWGASGSWVDDEGLPSSSSSDNDDDNDAASGEDDDKDASSFSSPVLCCNVGVFLGLCEYHAFSISFVTTSTSKTPTRLRCKGGEEDTGRLVVSVVGVVALANVVNWPSFTAVRREDDNDDARGLSVDDEFNSRGLSV